MRGVGGPLLCIGDLLSDVAADGGVGSDHQEAPSVPSSSSPPCPLPTTPNPVRPSDLPQLFEENYNELNKSLKGTDHSWTELTLKLCSALETADKLVQSASSNVDTLLDKVGLLENILKRGDSAVAIAKDIYDKDAQPNS